MESNYLDIAALTSQLSTGANVNNALAKNLAEQSAALINAQRRYADLLEAQSSGSKDRVNSPMHKSAGGGGRSNKRRRNGRRKHGPRE